MKESFLHYIWQLQYFNKEVLCAVDGSTIQVFKTGILNTNAGPDFLSAKIKIGPLEWVGSVEIHVKASEWNEHLHFRDAAYDNVVLHVVWVNDMPVLRSDGTLIPTLELKGRVDESLIASYKNLINSANPIACHKLITSVERLILVSMLDTALINRLESKAQLILEVLKSNNNDWEQTTFQLLAKNFGFKVNGESFECLAKALPYKYLLKQADNSVQVEALLFGQAGFLEPEVGDDYYQLLRREYKVLKTKFSLSTELKMAHWKFLRLRPANFPTLRIAQFAAIITSSNNLFSSIIDLNDSKQLKAIFEKPQSKYWVSHYRFNKIAKTTVPELGETSIATIMINTVAPLLVAYSKYMGDQRFLDYAIELLMQLKPEVNSITRNWAKLNVNAIHAYDSQALIELYNNFCVPKSCLLCIIGNSIIRPNSQNVA